MENRLHTMISNTFGLDVSLLCNIQVWEIFLKIETHCLQISYNALGNADRGIFWKQNGQGVSQNYTVQFGTLFTSSLIVYLM